VDPGFRGVKSWNFLLLFGSPAIPFEMCHLLHNKMFCVIVEHRHFTRDLLCITNLAKYSPGVVVSRGESGDEQS